jgi:hypothetical protein
MAVQLWLHPQELTRMKKSISWKTTDHTLTVDDGRMKALHFFLALA